MGEEDYKKLYDSVTAQEFDIGTFDEFVVKMQTQEQRRSFYDAMAENKLDLLPHLLRVGWRILRGHSPCRHYSLPLRVLQRLP